MEGGWGRGMDHKFNCKREDLDIQKKEEEEATEQIVEVPSLPSISEWSVKEQLDVL